MKKIIFLAILIAISFSVFSQEGLVSPSKKDTCVCQSSPKKEKQHRSTASSVGQIQNSFNDNIVIEDYTGQPVDMSKYTMPERFMPSPMVSNLKEINGSYNRNITVRRFPAPDMKPHCCGDYPYGGNHSGQDGLSLFMFFLFASMVALLIWGLIKEKRQTQPETKHASPVPHVIVPPSEKEMDAAMERAKMTGSVFTRRADGGYDIYFTSPKQEKPKENSGQ